MCFTLVFIEENGILNVEMRLVVVQVDVFGKDEDTYDFLIYSSDERQVGRVRIDGRFINCFINLIFLI